tara:strand:- start:11086 stop:11424 length:339 start_codon:yes stop_codon:yes gene_type:complete
MGLDEKFKRIHLEYGIINDRWLFMDKDQYNDADYLREIGANDIELLKLLKENPLWHTQVQRLTYILGVINNLSGNTGMAIVLPDDSVKARNLLIKNIIEDLIPIVEMINSCR